MSQIGVDKNIVFFGDRQADYAKKLAELDTYKYIRAAVRGSIKKSEKMLDIGNGLIFDYDINKIKKLFILDLFLDRVSARLPKNIVLVKGSALNIPFAKESFDVVLMEMLLHHLIGRSVGESINNVQLAINEGVRVLKPGGKLIIVESCVPNWFYRMETAVFPFAASIVSKTLTHPMAMQYPASLISKLLRQSGCRVKSHKIKKGRWLLQFGFRFPSILTPINPWIFVARKHRRKEIKNNFSQN